MTVDAPTGLGETHAVATEPWLRRTDVTGDQPVIHLSPTREAQEQALRRAESPAGIETDHVEVAPPYDAAGITTVLGATVAFEALCAMLDGGDGA